jgi:phage FluMu protein Com
MIFKVSSHSTKIFIGDDANSKPQYYISCPECKKKVLEEGSMFRCENCNKSLRTANTTYNFSARVSDISESIYVQFLGESGEGVMGMTA